MHCKYFLWLLLATAVQALTYRHRLIKAKTSSDASCNCTVHTILCLSVGSGMKSSIVNNG